MLHHLSIDLETFSSVPIGKAGAYKYIQSPDFEILLFAYSVDGSPVEIVDLAQGEILPEWLYAAVKSPEYIKHAYNAAFEWYCLSKFYGFMLPVNQWRDTMLHGLYCGFTAGLDATGKALGLPAEKQKLSTGKALIRYFCVPCNPTKANGGRTRNYPKHDPDKWELFKTYCIGDVVTEMEIDARLSAFPVPDDIEKQWQTDLTINARGVSVDMGMVRGALEIDAASRDSLMEEAVRITGLENPNSIAQLSQWLEKATNTPVTDLRKDTVAAMLESQAVTGYAERMLEIRQELGKTSTKKYDAIEVAVCGDRRVRGLLQFYGANRTGRWAGRLVQVQNLPRTYIGQLPLARDAVRNKESDKLRVLYGSVPDTLSQLIRTSFVASRGNKLVDADFSAIEARVISWLAGEQWRLEVFRTHGKIYEASASQMFGVPIEKIKKGNPEYELRQKGKVAELALGYQGSSGALISMGALKMGIPEEDLPDIVTRWRDANKMIVDLWYSLESAAVSVIQTGAPAGVRGLILAREFDIEHNLDFLTITLPSKRKLYYARPELGANQWGRPSILYRGVNQTTKQWTQLETYGGKLVENVVQAIARDCLAAAIEHLEEAGFPVVFHVHDEVVIDCPESKADLDAVVQIMTQPIPWAVDLPLNADGWVGDFFKKD
ncbi:DNA polymerase [uncultured Bacteroides sp.]|uniref:DNA polymerase n=1 Tax=uncultured Bacteroides sp. TaxID=162156 RepID=UPI0025916F98|nr:DNA polymerase [uncultured Bacteroides sp.]